MLGIATPCAEFATFIANLANTVASSRTHAERGQKHRNRKVDSAWRSTTAHPTKRAYGRERVARLVTAAGDRVALVAWGWPQPDGLPNAVPAIWCSSGGAASPRTRLSVRWAS